jgi:hypothetical protein
MQQAADEVRGVPPVTAADVLASLPTEIAELVQAAGGAPSNAPVPDSETAAALLAGFGLGSGPDSAAPLPERMAPILALVAALPAPLTERLLTELLARLIEPVAPAP